MKRRAFLKGLLGLVGAAPVLKSAKFKYPPRKPTTVRFASRRYRFSDKVPEGMIEDSTMRYVPQVYSERLMVEFYKQPVPKTTFRMG
jgi:hypothetical protein